MDEPSQDEDSGALITSMIKLHWRLIGTLVAFWGIFDSIESLITGSEVDFGSWLLIVFSPFMILATTIAWIAIYEYDEEKAVFRLLGNIEKRIPFVFGAETSWNNITLVDTLTPRWHPLVVMFMYFKDPIKKRSGAFVTGAFNEKNKEIYRLLYRKISHDRISPDAFRVIKKHVDQ